MLASCFSFGICGVLQLHCTGCGFFTAILLGSGHYMRMLLPVAASACRVVFGDAYASGIQDVEVTKSWPEWMPLWRVVKVKHCTQQQFGAPQPHMCLPHAHLCFMTNEFNICSCCFSVEDHNEHHPVTGN